MKAGPLRYYGVSGLKDERQVWRNYVWKSKQDPNKQYTGKWIRLFKTGEPVTVSTHSRYPTKTEADEAAKKLNEPFGLKCIDYEHGRTTYHKMETAEHKAARMERLEATRKRKRDIKEARDATKATRARGHSIL